MILLKRPLVILPLIFLMVSGLEAGGVDDVLKRDFTAQQTVLINFEVNKRLYAFEAGKFKIENIRKNREKIRSITKKIIPWAIMEHLKPDEVARIIVYMYHADEAGAAFDDAEDLIPLVAQKDIPLNDFILMVQYNRETKRGRIPEEIRQGFLGQAFDKQWDGLSILAGGRGLLLARSINLNINKAASLLLRRIPPKGADVPSGKLIHIVESSIRSALAGKRSKKLIQNLDDIHKIINRKEESPGELKKIIDRAKKIDYLAKRIGEIKIKDKTRPDKKIDRENGILPDREDKESRITGKRWKTLSRSRLMSAIKPWLRTPYRYGGKTRRGIDCSGFTRAVLIDTRVGVPSKEVGYSTKTQKHAGTPVTRRNLRAGDLVFFSASPNRSKITHVGMATSSTAFSHASCSRGVTHDSLTKKWWRLRYVKSRRIFTKVVE